MSEFKVQISNIVNFMTELIGANFGKTYTT